MPKILIVDDSRESRDALAGRLQCRGFAVVVADDGKMGVSMAQTEKPDLILMDMNMPEMDGWEATRQIKSAPEARDIPIIALIEANLPASPERALEEGCVTCHNKPFEFSDLLSEIETLLKNRPIPETV